MQEIFFYIFAALTLLFGFLVVANPFSRNPVTSAMFLVVMMACLAGLFVTLHAFFIAAVQILVYAGAVMVLFLFVIMLVSIEQSLKEEQFSKLWVVGLVSALALGGLFVAVYLKGKGIFPERVMIPPETSNTQEIANYLYGNYMFAFEIASLLLLVAIIGAVVMAKKRI